MNMSGLIIKMLIFMVLMLIGYVSVKKGIAGSEFSQATSKLLLSIFMPATIISSILKADMEINLPELLHLIFVMTVAIVVCLIIGIMAVKILPADKKIKPDLELLMDFPNTMFIALPVLDELFGAVAVFYCILSCMPFNLLIFTYGIWKLQKGGQSSRIKLGDIMSPPLLSTILAIILLIFKVPVPRAASELLNSLSSATLPLSMILIGVSMGGVSLSDAFKKKSLYPASFVKLAVAPFAAWLLCRMLTDDTILLYSAVICAASPSAAMLSALSIRYGGDGEFASQGIMHSTVISLVTIPAVVFMLGLGG